MDVIFRYILDSFFLYSHPGLAGSLELRRWLSMLGEERSGECKDREVWSVNSFIFLQALVIMVLSSASVGVCFVDSASK